MAKLSRLSRAKSKSINITSAVNASKANWAAVRIRRFLSVGILKLSDKIYIEVVPDCANSMLKGSIHGRAEILVALSIQLTGAAIMGSPILD